MLVLVFILVTMLMLAVYTIIVLYSRKITRPIMKLTTYTHMMNQAQDREDKIHVVRRVKRDETFADIALEYEAADFIKKNPKAVMRPDSFKESLRRADTALIRDVEKDSVGEPRVMGTKLSKIKERALHWNNRSDEILELKKIFYEFLKNLVSSREN